MRVSDGEEGAVAIQLLAAPQAVFPGLWKRQWTFCQILPSDYPGYYASGDGVKDSDGYFFITGRIDDVIM